MAASARRPAGVVFVSILLIISGVLSIVSGALGLIGASEGSTAVVEGQQLNSISVGMLSGVFLVIGILNVLLAIGVFRGSRAARMIVTILQILALISGVTALVSTGSFSWEIIHGILFPVVIVTMLWTGADTKAFFDRSR